MIGEVACRYLMLDASPSSGGEAGRRSPGFGSRPPLNLHVAALRDVRSLPAQPGDPHNALSLLRSWANDVRVARDQAPHRNESLSAATHYLMTSLDWITRQPAVTQFRDELRAVQSQLRSANGEPNPRPIGWCIEPLDDTATSWCNSPLFPPREGINIRCSVCHATYDPLRQIKLKIQNEREVCACGHSDSQHNNDAPTLRPCNAKWCSCPAYSVEDLALPEAV